MLSPFGPTGALKPIPTATLPSGEAVPVLGQGTYRMGENARERKSEVAALRRGIDLGMTLIDTAEMYGDGGAERVVGEAIAGRRDAVFIVSKVLPEHANRRGTIAACERSLKRLKTDRIDLYLLHWREDIPLSETLEGFYALLHARKIRYWGVSNFDVKDMTELLKLPGGKAVAVNQVMYNLGRRGIEYDLIAWSRRHRIPIMAYSPLNEGKLMLSRELKRVAERLDATPAQVALAWLLRRKNIIAVPKAADEDKVRDNRLALELRFGRKDLGALDRAFPPPKKKQRLAMV
jgi:diketogulonate reductase-like aldo/keto reductase